jgi:glycine dehydrogenase
VIDKKIDGEDNPLKNAPHTVAVVIDDKWDHPYSREKEVYPLVYLKDHYKFWPPVSRIDNAYGDRNLYCTCIPTEEYDEMGIKPLI